MSKKFKFQFIGHPNSPSNPGVVIEVEEWDVPEMKRQSHDWLDLNAAKETEAIKDKFHPKVRGQRARNAQV